MVKETAPPKAKSGPRIDRERKRRRENRDTILRAAEEVLLGKGVSAMSMDDVAAAAAFSKATLYRYFRSKAELVFAVMDHFLEGLDARLRTAAAGPGRVRDRLAAWTEESLRFLVERENLTRVFLLDRSFVRLFQIFLGTSNRSGTEAERSFMRKIRAKRAEINERSRTLIQAGIAAGEFRRIDPSAGVMFLEAVIEGYFVEQFWMEAKSDLDRDIAQIVDFILRGLETRPSR